MIEAINTRARTEKSLRQRARGAAEAVFAAGVQTYDRDRDLMRLIHASPAELADCSPGTARSLLSRLARALRSERNRGRAGHWTYDLNRHIALRQAYEAERMRLNRDRSHGGSRRTD